MNQDFVLNFKVRGDSAQAETSLGRLQTALVQVDRALGQVRAAGRAVTFDAQAAPVLAAQRAITAEVERRTRLEADAAARNAAALRQQAVEQARIAERRAASTAVFSAATPEQLRTPVERTAALGQAQALQRDAALRMLEINRRADALEARLATTRTGLATATVTAARATDVGRRAVDQYGISVGQTRQAMRQLPAQITDIFTSLAGGQKPWLVAIQQGGQLKDSFGGIVPAARALLGALSPMVIGLGLTAAAIGAVAVAAVSGYRETQAYERALIASGNAAATTAGQLRVVKDSVGGATGEYGNAEAALTALAAAGTVAGDTLEAAASAAVNLSELTGASIEDTTQKVIALARAPSAQLLELNQQYRFLSVEVYQHVRALEAQGRAQDAARLAIETFARVHEQRVQEAYARAGSLERAWINLGKIIGGVWQTIRNIGRDDLAFRLKKTTDELDRIGNEWRELGGINSLDAVLASRDVDADTKQRIRALRQEQATLQREANAEQAKADAQAATQARQTNAINALGRAQAALGQDRAVAKAQQLRELERDISALRAGGVTQVEGASLATFEKTRRAQIDAQFQAPKAPRVPKPKATDADRAREAAERELESLRREIALLAEVEAGQTRAGEAARIRYETTQGALKSLAPAVKAQLLQEAEALDKARAAAEAERERKAELEKTTRAYETLRASLRTPAEVALEEARAQVTLLNDALRDGIATKAAFDAAMARVAQTSFRKPDAVPGGPDLGQTGNDLAQIEQSRTRLEAWHAEQLALLAQFRSQRADLNAQWDAQEETIERQHQAALAQLQSAQTQVLLAGASATFGQLADIAKSFGGEQSATYRALFALSKAFAIAQAALALANNVAEASKVGFPQNIPFIAGAIAQGATIAGLIAQATFNGGGGYASGGHVRGPGTATSDSIPAWLSDFEFVTRAAVVRQPGALPFLEDFNRRGMPALEAWHARRFAGATPPAVSLPRAPRMHFAEGGLARAAAGLNPQLNLRLINAINTDALAESMAQSRGLEQTILNVIDRNGSFLRQRIGGA
jgi:phage-related minor tail protein